MIKEDYVSFEVAKLLKEKGFDGEWHKHYWGYFPGKEFLTEGLFNPEYDYPAPTLQMAMKWLREVHNRYIEICTDNAYNSKDIVFRPTIFDKKLNYLWESDNYSTYEEACEAAIKYVLENLI